MEQVWGLRCLVYRAPIQLHWFYCRFGIGSTTQGSESSKQPEELKRKARAERYFIALPIVCFKTCDFHWISLFDTSTNFSDLGLSSLHLLTRKQGRRLGLQGLDRLPRSIQRRMTRRKQEQSGFQQCHIFLSSLDLIGGM